MPQIGQFTREKTGFAGRIQTLMFIADVALVPAEASDAENAPDYRIHLGGPGDSEIGPEIGAGWKRTGESAGEFIALVIDDPAFPQPIRANLFRDDDAEPPGRCTGAVRRSATHRTDAMRRAVLLLLAGLSFATVMPASRGRRPTPGRELQRAILMAGSSPKPRTASRFRRPGSAPSSPRRATAIRARHRRKARWA